jgi:hypothetical protein
MRMRKRRGHEDEKKGGDHEDGWIRWIPVLRREKVMGGKLHVRCVKIVKKRQACARRR